MVLQADITEQRHRALLSSTWTFHPWGLSLLIPVRIKDCAMYLMKFLHVFHTTLTCLLYCIELSLWPTRIWTNDRIQLWIHSFCYYWALIQSMSSELKWWIEKRPEWAEKCSLMERNSFPVLKSVLYLKASLEAVRVCYRDVLLLPLMDSFQSIFLSTLLCEKTVFLRIEDLWQGASPRLSFHSEKYGMVINLG